MNPMQRGNTPNFSVCPWFESVIPERLSIAQRAAARASFDAWSEESRNTATFEDYVAYIIDRHRQSSGQGGFLVQADTSYVFGPGAEPGWSRRKRHLADILGGSYKTAIPIAVNFAIVGKVEICRTQGTATIKLTDGSSLIDQGDIMTLHQGKPYGFAAVVIASVAANRGWRSVKLTGPASFELAVTIINEILARGGPLALTGARSPTHPEIDRQTVFKYGGRLATEAPGEKERQTRALAIATTAIADSTRRVESLMARRPRSLDIQARRAELDAFERSARERLADAAEQTGRLASERRRSAGFLNVQACREARNAEAAAAEAREALERYNAANTNLEQDILERVAAELNARHRLQLAFDDSPATKEALEELALDRLVLAMLERGDPALVTVILNNGLAGARLLLRSSNLGSVQP